MARDPVAKMALILEEARRHSHTIFATDGHNLPRLLQDNDLWTTIDKGYAWQFLMSENSISAAESHGGSLRRPHLVLIILEVIQFIAAIGVLIAGFVSFRWWALLLLFVLPVFVIRSWRSSQLPRLRGRLPKTVAFASGVATLYLAARGAAWNLWMFTLAAALLSLSAVLRYAYPVQIVERSLLQNPDITPALIDAGVLTLHRASELPEVRNRGF